MFEGLFKTATTDDAVKKKERLRSASYFAGSAGAASVIGGLLSRRKISAKGIKGTIKAMAAGGISGSVKPEIKDTAKTISEKTVDGE